MMKKCHVPTPFASVISFTVMLVLSSASYGVDREVVPGMSVVSDPALAKMRGKYVASNSQVIYFGVQMQSNWDAPNGALLSAGAAMSVNFTTVTPTVSFVPTVSVVIGDNGGELADTTNRNVSNDGINNVSGITQSVQTAGDFNSTDNLARINFLSEVPAEEALNGGPIFASFDEVQNGVAMSGYSSLEDNAAVVHLEMDGQGVVEQSIRGTVDGVTGRGVYQTIMLLGDRHQISNQLEMNVVVGEESAQFLQQQGMGAAIGTLRGLNP